MSLELWLVRHAESLGNVDGSQADTRLSENGQSQARRLGGLLLTEPFDLITSSPLIRAQETASRALPEDSIYIDARLSEWRTLQDTFLDPATLGARGWESLLHAPSSQEETFQEFQERLAAWLASLPSEGRVIAFTHYAVVRECIRHLSQGRHILEDVPHCHPFQIMM